ncbi:MAG: hypothetical protein RLZZ162_3432 [Verrucomicrobiota bacterium]|jgi:hypothetical protein
MQKDKSYMNTTNITPRTVSKTRQALSIALAAGALGSGGFHTSAQAGTCAQSSVNCGSSTVNGTVWQMLYCGSDTVKTCEGLNCVTMEAQCGC